MQRVVVIGAGMAGLVSALELAARGAEVTVVERASRPGGKMRQVHIGGNWVDAGPTVFTMRWVFDELFDAIGESLDDHVVLRRTDVLARHAWGADERLDLYADLDHSADAIGQFAGAAEARRYRSFCERARRTYETLEHPFLRAAQPSLRALVLGAGLHGLGDLLRVSPFTTLWDALCGHFQDPRLRQLFGRYATYCGSSPFLAPATLMLVAHVERDGVWLVEGGMHRVAQALARLGKERGARFLYDSEVLCVCMVNGRAVGVQLANGDRLHADAVVVNADVAALGEGLFGTQAARAVPRIPRAARSLSALTWTLVARTAGFPLLRHTVFFSDDYAAEFDDILRHARLPSRPTVYVCAQDRDDKDGQPPTGPERLLCLVNAPACGDAHRHTAAEVAACEQRAFGLLERCGLTIHRRCDLMLATTPADFERLYPATGGALYGQASHGWRTSFTRPGARTRVPGLYVAGGSAHPGPGVPMAALSGRLAAASVLQDLARRGARMRTRRAEP